MSYVLGLVVATVFFVALNFFTQLNKKQKLLATATVLAIISMAIAYNEYSAYESAKVREIEVLFAQDRSITCNESTEVNSTNFTYSSGTQTFIGKKETPYYTIMISAYNCK
ncbi:MAG: hypothetical protein U9N42_06275 [Campylobacterota bacterium]|nr:hypothetical protein [Campylobacterota bacterium]